MADALNIYFCSVFTSEDKNNLPVHEPLLADNVECLTNMLITPTMIVTKIKQKLKDNKQEDGRLVYTPCTRCTVFEMQFVQTFADVLLRSL